MKNNLLKEFNESRTPFFKSFSFLLIESIIPGFLIWFTIGYDFKFSLNEKLPTPHVGYLALICTVYLIYSCLLTYLFYKLKFHEIDNFTFAQISTIIFIAIIMFGTFMKSSSLWILIRFISILLIVVVLTPLFVFIGTLIRNNDLRRVEDLERTYEAYKKGEIIPDKKLLKAQRYQKYLVSKIQKEEELEKFKLELDEKIKRELKEQELKEKLKAEKINKKLDAKENKKREKQKD
ncbi:DxFTY motif-containing membrane protein [Spiroplasma sp. BIUS-1]|uniref:DxFTY motif-containing membrane protein n=1 Tax=Spiroplasma sp. BIUS-1 TaxID=216964 RepID=UPI0013971E11|nr:hypothetical protein [Spiroplasma sp. BIUS-1]QHX36593.1 hypothetical protein SBIUS_v1c03400 [Spiroplasma sp. BIUS-1]